MAKSIIRVLFSIFLLSSCTLGPPYKVPCTEVPQQWKRPDTAPDVNASSDCEAWWKVFNDPYLNDLECLAIQNNRNIYVSLERVFQARAMAGVRGADLYPQITLNPSYTNIGALVKIFGTPSTPPGTPKIPTIIRTHYMNYSLPLNLRYELDLFGRLKSIEESALLNVEAQEMAFLSTQLIVTSELASEYFQLRSLDTRLDILQDTIKIRQEGLVISKDRYESGFTDYSDVTRTETLLYSAEVQYFKAARERALKENRIATLLGVPASDFEICHFPLIEMPPSIPSGVPAAILRQRPDIRELERRAASEHAMIGAAYASFFPDISLTGILGFSSPDLRHFLTWKSRLWSIGGSMTQPIFDGYRNISNLQQAWARFREASGTYQQGVLEAFSEVEDSLATLEFEFHEMEWAEKAVKSSAESLEILHDRYLKGLSNYLDVIESERSRLESRLVAIDLLGERYVATVRLIKSLGGSWMSEQESSSECE